MLGNRFSGPREHTDSETSSGGLVSVSEIARLSIYLLDLGGQINAAGR